LLEYAKLYDPSSYDTETPQKETKVQSEKTTVQAKIGGNTIQVTGAPELVKELFGLFLDKVQGSDQVLTIPGGYVAGTAIANSTPKYTPEPW
jgi:hypothetical protein